MAVFNPQLFANLPQAPAPDIPAPMPEMAAPMAPPMVPPPAPAAPPPQAPQPVFIPVPIQIKPTVPKIKGVQISPDAARKAQGIYPKESAEKQQMIENAKAPPTPTGAWGAPE